MLPREPFLIRLQVVLIALMFPRNLFLKTLNCFMVMHVVKRYAGNYSPVVMYFVTKSLRFFCNQYSLFHIIVKTFYSSRTNLSIFLLCSLFVHNQNSLTTTVPIL